MNNMAEIKGHLTLIGEDFSCTEVSERLCTDPTWYKSKEDILGNGRAFGHCEWGVETNIFYSDDLTSTATSIMSLLSCSQRKMRQTASDFQAEWHILFSISCTGSKNSIPELSLPPVFLKFAADIDASLGFDLIL